MHAILVDDQRHLHWRETETPAPTSHEVRIRVHATAVNRADTLQARGFYPPPPGESPILGLECAGEVDAVGDAVTRWRVGDAVVALLAGGGYAEQVVVPEGQVLPLPAGLDFVAGAAIPEVFATAWLNLFKEARLQPGELVLLHAGASGVGTAAIQLCKQFDNPCFVTLGNQDKLDRCLALGADGGHLRTAGEFEPAVADWATDGVDVILDPVGGAYLEQNLKVLRHGGRLVLIGLMGGASAPIGLAQMLMKRLRLIGSTLRSRSRGDKAELMADMERNLWPLFECDALRPVVHTHFPIQEADKAFALVESNQTFGKVVLTLAD